ncbi:pancreatic progenitor cell differentiation and proliferation factor-like protein [Ambystoma mexicanum]|uniref:pancreatic progenitor cell differentiation and proliferation factor-like protein n=1 Tax=Ambystoma mexicanum TaxID=8296 RepID=UPI0037E73AD4
MASVPSTICLTAKNQFHRTRLISESSTSSSCSSSFSDAGHPGDQEKANHGLPEMFEKCWWLKNFFHCEQVPATTSRIDLSADRAHS